MSQNEGTQKIPEEDSDRSRVSMLALAIAVPAEEMPKFLQERMQQKPAAITLEEVRNLDESTRTQVLATLERAIAHYREDADRYRARTNPAQRAADQLEAFLEAARK
jgi:hypothetical protein